MKMLSGLGLCLLLSIPALAQDAREGTVRYKGEDRNGVMADYDAPKGVTEDALDKRIGEAKIGKKRHESDFWKYEGVTWPEISPNKVDVYFNVERHKGKSVVYMMVSPGNGNFVTTATDPQAIGAMKAFLTRFKDDIAAYQQGLAVAAQQRTVADAEQDKKRADRDAERAAKRQKKADRAREKTEQKAAEEQKKLNELQQSKP